MRNWSVFTVRLGGVELRIHLTFLFLLIFLLLIEVSRAGPRVVPRVFILAGLILMAVLLHEIGHAVVSARQGLPIKGILLLPVGGLAMVDPTVQGESARNLRRETLIALAGPLVNAILAGATAIVLLTMAPAHRSWLPPAVTAANLVASFFLDQCLPLRFQPAAGLPARWWTHLARLAGPAHGVPSGYAPRGEPWPPFCGAVHAGRSRSQHSVADGSGFLHFHGGAN
jgi:hypothetical protein